MGYSRWNWGLYPGCGWDSTAQSWLPGRLAKATLTQGAARPAFQVKCWLVDTSVNQLWNHHHNVLIDHTGLMTQLLAWRGCVLHSLGLQPSEKEHFEQCLWKADTNCDLNLPGELGDVQSSSGVLCTQHIHTRCSQRTRRCFHSIILWRKVFKMPQTGLKQNFNAISVDFSLCLEILENADYFMKE